MQTGRTRFTPFSSLQKIKYDEDNNLLLTTIENELCQRLRSLSDQTMKSLLD